MDYLQNQDPAVYEILQKELERQTDHLEMIASENFTSPAVMEAMGSIFTNKYAEGYPGKRYYGGCEWADAIENLAIERAKELFGCEYVNVQPHSGSQANQGVYLALLKPYDKILGMDLSHGGHLTHGAKVNASGKIYQSFFYGVNDEGWIDYDRVLDIARIVKPKLIICGASAYPRVIDFEKFRAIADEVGALLMADIAHIAGLVAAGEHPSPFPHCDVVTTTTHKTLRGPRGGMIMTNDPEIAKKVNSAIFPGIQGGPLVHVIAAKAVGFGENLKPEWKEYAKQVRLNAQRLATILMERGYNVGRHRQPPGAGELSGQRLQRQGRRRGPGARRHHRQQKHRPRRDPKPLCHQRYPHRLSGADCPGDERGGIRAHRPPHRRRPGRHPKHRAAGAYPQRAHRACPTLCHLRPPHLLRVGGGPLF